MATVSRSPNSSLHFVYGYCDNIVIRKTSLPAGSFVYRCCWSRLISDWSENLSISSTSHWSCGRSLLMAAYSFTKASGFFDRLSKVSISAHCCFGSSLIPRNATISSAPMTVCWHKKPMILAGLTLSTTVVCSLLNLSFNTSFDSGQLNISLD